MEGEAEDFSDLVLALVRGSQQALPLLPCQVPQQLLGPPKQAHLLGYQNLRSQSLELLLNLQGKRSELLGLRRP